MVRRIVIYLAQLWGDGSAAVGVGGSKRGEGVSFPVVSVSAAALFLSR